jgi:hypothetical protein
VEGAVDGYERFAAAAAREAVLEDELPILTSPFCWGVKNVGQQEEMLLWVSETCIR